jgi:hypothetical protein
MIQWLAHLPTTATTVSWPSLDDPSTMGNCQVSWQVYNGLSHWRGWAQGMSVISQRILHKDKLPCGDLVEKWEKGPTSDPWNHTYDKRNLHANRYTVRAHIASICAVEVNKLCSSNAALTSLCYHGIINFKRQRLQLVRTEYKCAIDLNMVKSDMAYTHLCMNVQIDRICKSASAVLS